MKVSRIRGVRIRGVRRRGYILFGFELEFLVVEKQVGSILA